MDVGYKNFQFFAKTGMREKGAPTAPFETVFDSDENIFEDERSFFELKYSSQINEKFSFLTRAPFSEAVERKS